MILIALGTVALIAVGVVGFVIWLMTPIRDLTKEKYEGRDGSRHSL